MRIRHTLLGILTGASIVAMVTTPAAAEASEQARPFDIPAQPLASALFDFSRQADRMVLVSPALTRDRQSTAVRGTFPPDEALARLLAGSGLRGARKGRGYVVERNVARLTKAEQPNPTPSPVEDAQGSKDEQPRSAAETMAGDIVVSARKKSAGERAQDVPVSLSAVSGEQIEAAFAKDLTDVGQRMPNVRLDTLGVFPGVANYAIRGMGFVSGIASTEPTVGVFSDGIYLGVNLGGSPDTFDLESVEVLRGPQGTLFGRNVTGGAVIMRSRRPDGETKAAVRIGAGNGERVTAAASIEGGLSDTLAAKIFAQYAYQGGYFHNTFLDRDQGEQRDTFVRGTLRWRPSAPVDVTAIYEHGRMTGEGPAARILNDTVTAAYRNGTREPVGTNNLALDVQGATRLHWNQAVLDASYDVGPGTLTSVTGYRDVSYFSDGDGDGSPLNISRGFIWTKQHQFSEELRYAGQAFDDKLDFTVGVYYFQQRLEQRYQLNLNGTPIFRPKGMLRHRTASVFAQGDYEFMPDAFLTAGLRYTWERKRARIARGNNCDAAFVCTFPFKDAESWDNLSPKLGLSWRITPDVLAYASWTRGFRSGGYNTRTTGATESPGPYDEEVVQAYEAGLKTEFWNRRGRVNLSVFHNKYKNLQRTIFDPVTFANRISNAASATIDGAELEATFLPMDALALTGFVGYLDARYDRFDALDVTGDGIPDPALAPGTQLIRAPDWTYGGTATYDIALGDDAGKIVSRLSYSYTGSSPLNDGNTRRLKSYGLVDGSISWSSVDDQISLSLWGKNLANKKYGLTGATSALFTVVYQSPPRSYGLQLAYKY